MLNFADFGLDSKIIRAINDQGYTKATPIQAQAIPAILAKHDVMGAAQTGTGKTAAFVLPIVQLLLPFTTDSTSPAKHPVRALILTPTRELANQVFDNIKNYAHYTNLRAGVIFGGIDIAPQIINLRRGVEIIIATPGRLLDHLQQKTINLSQVQILVLDEADRMLDMGFLLDLQKIMDCLPHNRQTLLFSATFSNPIKKLAQHYLRNPDTIEVSEQNSASVNIEQMAYLINEEDKTAAILHVLTQLSIKQCIIFCNSKLGCALLSRNLIKFGVRAGALHGDKSQAERMHLLQNFKDGKIDSLVATDVAARGLDISEMPCVINFDLPYVAQDYVHRIGRTGRAGAIGRAISFCTKDDKKLLSDIEKVINSSLKPICLENFTSHKYGKLNYKNNIKTQDYFDNQSNNIYEAHKDSFVGSILKNTDPIFTKPYQSQQPLASIPVKTDRPNSIGLKFKISTSKNTKLVAALLRNNTSL